MDKKTIQKYFKPKSLSWWSAVSLATIQLLRALGVTIPAEVDGLVIALFGVGMRGAVK